MNIIAKLLTIHLIILFHHTTLTITEVTSKDKFNNTENFYNYLEEEQYDFAMYQYLINYHPSLSSNFTQLNHSIMDFSKNEELLVNLYMDIKLWRSIFIIVGAIITICGCTLNTLCIFIFYKSNLFQNSSFPCYVYVLSIVDSLSLIIRYVVPQASEFYVSNKLFKKYNATNDAEFEEYTDLIVSDYHCNIVMYIHNTLGCASTWLMVAISIERWLVIKYPLQTKSMIKLRAFLILTIIIFIVFIINIFDLSPNFYNKPHWFSNLTLLCEPFDSIQYITLGSLSLNADVYSFIRILLQAIGPFIVALLFNSLIIYNFKRIKSAAYNIKSNTSAVVSPAHSSVNLSKQASPNHINYKNNKKNSSLYVGDGNDEARSSQPVLSLSPTDCHNYGSKLTPPLTTTTSDSNTNSTQAISSNPDTRQASVEVSNNNHRNSFKKHLSKLKLHRETDVMLIVLSFSILITQLPCTITWYLIYYRLLLTHINDIYLAARIPVLIYILRLVEMLYFSMNFVFYITLSPSLRKELNVSPVKLFRKLFLKKRNSRSMKQGKVREFYLNKTNTRRPAEESQMINPEKKVVKEKLSLFSRFANLGKNNQKYNKNSKLLIYKIKSTKDQQKDYDIKIVIDNYETNSNNIDKLLNNAEDLPPQSSNN
jgi:hypothetical protein